jgi:hypothetical protein
MKYSVTDLLVSSLLQWVFSEKHPSVNAEYAPDTFVQLLMIVAQAKDYVESISGLFSYIVKRVGF